MKKCNYCGQDLDDDAKFCPNCGARCDTNNTSTETTNGSYSYYDPNVMAQPPRQPQSNDSPSVGFGILSFFFPLVGLILFLIWHSEYPRKAKSCGIGALVSVICYVLLICCFVIFIIIAASAGMQEYY